MITLPVTCVSPDTDKDFVLSIISLEPIVACVFTNNVEPVTFKPTERLSEISTFLFKETSLFTFKLPSILTKSLK